MLRQHDDYNFRTAKRSLPAHRAFKVKSCISRLAHFLLHRRGLIGREKAKLSRCSGLVEKSASSSTVELAEGLTKSAVLSALLLLDAPACPKAVPVKHKTKAPIRIDMVPFIAIPSTARYDSPTLSPDFRPLTSDI